MIRCRELNLDSWDEICNGCLNDRARTIHALVKEHTFKRNI